MYNHKIVQGLADLIEKYGGGGKDPMMRAVWYGVKGQIPTLLQTLDANESAVSEIRSKLMEVLEVEEYIEKEVAERIAALLTGKDKYSATPVEPVTKEEIKKAIKPKKAKKQKPAAEAEITIEPLEEASGD